MVPEYPGDVKQLPVSRQLYTWSQTVLDAVFTFASKRVVCRIWDLSLDTPGMPSLEGAAFGWARSLEDVLRCLEGPGCESMVKDKVAVVISLFYQHMSPRLATYQLLLEVT